MIFITNFLHSHFYYNLSASHYYFNIRYTMLTSLHVSTVVLLHHVQMVKHGVHVSVCPMYSRYRYRWGGGGGGGGGLFIPQFKPDRKLLTERDRK